VTPPAEIDPHLISSKRMKIVMATGAVLATLRVNTSANIKSFQANTQHKTAVAARPGPTIGGIRTPIGFKRKPGLIFIEKPRKRLSEVTEIKGIQLARLRRRK